MAYTLYGVYPTSAPLTTSGTLEFSLSGTGWQTSDALNVFFGNVEAEISQIVPGIITGFVPDYPQADIVRLKVFDPSGNPSNFLFFGFA